MVQALALWAAGLPTWRGARGARRHSARRWFSEMSQFLKIHGGVMDYGKFSTAFAGVKKPQLGGHFKLAPESGDAGGRWRIALPGAEPLLRDSGGQPRSWVCQGPWRRPW